MNDDPRKDPDFADLAYRKLDHKPDGPRWECPGCAADDAVRLETIVAARVQLTSASIEIGSVDRLARLALRSLGVPASEWPVVARPSVPSLSSDWTPGLLSAEDRRLLEAAAAEFLGLGTVAGARLGASILAGLSAARRGYSPAESYLAEIESWVAYSIVSRLRLAGRSLLSAIYVNVARAAAASCRESGAVNSALSLDSLIDSYVGGGDLDPRSRASCESGSFGCDLRSIADVMLVSIAGRRRQDPPVGNGADPSERTPAAPSFPVFERAVAGPDLTIAIDRSPSPPSSPCRLCGWLGLTGTTHRCLRPRGDLRSCAGFAGSFLRDQLMGRVGEEATAIELALRVLAGERDAIESYARRRPALEAFAAQRVSDDLTRAIVVLMEQVDDEIRFSTEEWRHHGPRCLVHLSVAASSCEEAIRESGSSPSKVMIGADVLLAVLDYAHRLTYGLIRLDVALRTDGESRGSDLGDLILAARRGPIVDGPGVADAEGDVVKIVGPDARRLVDGY